MYTNNVKDISNVGKGFDRITFFYDAMSRIASFNCINKSQVAFLPQLSTQATCLILGGGTGYFLQKLLEENKTIQITYVDASEKMIEYAQKRIAKGLPDALHRITFTCKRVEDFEFDRYNVIVCNYFLDLFDDVYVGELILRFKKHMNRNALLYITDFTIPEKGFMHWSTKAGLNLLYLFFSRATFLTTQHLPNIESIVLQHNFVLRQSVSYFKGVLKCRLYKQSD